MRITIETIPHFLQRYDTVGDYVGDIEANPQNLNGLLVRVSDMGDWREQFLVAIHELIEAGLCKAAGVTHKQIDAFDFDFNGEGEPGDDPTAPYHVQHRLATHIERMLADHLGVNWSRYEEHCNAMSEDWKDIPIP